MNYINRFHLEDFFAKHEFNTTYNLGGSTCETFSIKEILNLTGADIDHFMNLNLGYTKTYGDDLLRKEILKLYDYQLNLDTLVTCGGEEAIYAFMMTFLKSSDHVIVQVPTYQSLFEIPKNIGCKISYWQMREEENWSPSIDQLQYLITPNTKLLVLNSPNNPTGYTFTKDQQNEIIHLARKFNIVIFSDEAYRFMSHDGKETTSFCSIYENAISLGVAAKSFGLAGLRIGWLTSQNKNLLQNAHDFKHYLSICSSAPSEYLFKIALLNKEKLLKRNLEIVLKNKNQLKTFFQANEKYFSGILPNFGCICFPKLKRIGAGEFCNELIQTASILIIPSTLFEHGNGHVRIGFGMNSFEQGLHQFEKFLLNYPLQK